MKIFNLYTDISTATKNSELTYEIKLELNYSEIKKSISVPIMIQLEEAFIKALSDNIYEFKDNYYPTERVSFLSTICSLMSYHKELHDSYVTIFNGLNENSEEIIDIAKTSYSPYPEPMRKNMDAYIKKYILENFLENDDEKKIVRKIKI
jgi:hypothetical protein